MSIFLFFFYLELFICILNDIFLLFYTCIYLVPKLPNDNIVITESITIKLSTVVDKCKKNLSNVNTLTNYNNIHEQEKIN